MLFFTLLLLFGFENEMPSKIEYDMQYSIEDEKYAPFFRAALRHDSIKLVPDIASDTISYTDRKTAIGQLRQQLGNKFRMGAIGLDSIKLEFTNHLVEKIIPHWYGTPWSFGGHTAIPNQGKIACGYFISTTLRDMGINLNRYKLAQKSPIDEAKIISCGTMITSVMEDSPEKAIEEIERITKEGLHFIGFDTGHVGYLLKRKSELFLIHSNYLSPVSVCIEPLEDSKVFKSFSKFHIVDISNNDVLIQRWLNNEVVF